MLLFFLVLLKGWCPEAKCGRESDEIVLIMLLLTTVLLYGWCPAGGVTRCSCGMLLVDFLLGGLAAALAAGWWLQGIGDPGRIRVPQRCLVNSAFSVLPAAGTSLPGAPQIKR